LLLDRLVNKKIAKGCGAKDTVGPRMDKSVKCSRKPCRDAQSRGQITSEGFD
jgi:hypothetical protein